MMKDVKNGQKDITIEFSLPVQSRHGCTRGHWTTSLLFDEDGFIMQAILNLVRVEADRMSAAIFSSNEYRRKNKSNNEQQCSTRNNMFEVIYIVFGLLSKQEQNFLQQHYPQGFFTAGHRSLLHSEQKNKFLRAVQAFNNLDLEVDILDPVRGILFAGSAISDAINYYGNITNNNIIMEDDINNFPNNINSCSSLYLLISRQILLALIVPH